MLYYWWCVWVAERRERVDKRKERGNGAAFEWQNCVQFNGATLSRFFSGHIGTNEGLTFFTSTPDWDLSPAASYVSLWGEKVHSCPICTSQGEERMGHPMRDKRKISSVLLLFFVVVVVQSLSLRIKVFPTRDQIDDECYSVSDSLFLSIKCRSLFSQSLTFKCCVTNRWY